MAQGKTPPFRLVSFALAGFRSFTTPTLLPLARGEVGEGVVVLQGENSAGKSSALGALDLFFRAALACLAAGASGSSDAELTARWDTLASVGHRDLLVRRRDRPEGYGGPTVLEARFVGKLSGALRVTVAEDGSGARVKLEHSERGQNFFEPDRATCAALLAALEHPCGPESRPLALMNARRRALWLPEDGGVGVIPPGLLVQLFRLRTSLDPQERRRWRAFTEALGRFGVFAGKEISVERLDTGGPQLLVETPGRSVVPLGELGAGEQHLAALTAALLLGRGAILAIEKPELSLDTRHQRALIELLEEHGQQGQVLLESNAPGIARGVQVRFVRGASGEITAELADAPTAATRASAPQKAPAPAALARRGAAV
jgi:hypothetical protein